MLTTLDSNHLIVKYDKKLTNSVSAEITKKWFWLGLIQFVPICAGTILTMEIEELLYSYDYLTFGIAISTIITLLARNKSPIAPIGVNPCFPSTYKIKGSR